MNSANPGVLPNSQQRAPREAQEDNVYIRNPGAGGPQAYVPYAPANRAPYGRSHSGEVPADTGMLTVAIVGLAVSAMLGVPIGVITGPNALKRARKVEHFVNVGKRPRSDLSNVTAARICAWISIIWSIPLVILWALVFVGALFAIAG